MDPKQTLRPPIWEQPRDSHPPHPAVTTARQPDPENPENKRPAQPTEGQTGCNIMLDFDQARAENLGEAEIQAGGGDGEGGGDSSRTSENESHSTDKSTLEIGSSAPDTSPGHSR